MQKSLTRLQAEQVSQGVELPWTLYNEKGIPLFKKGFVVHSKANLKRLLSMNLFYDLDETSRSNKTAPVTTSITSCTGCGVPKNGKLGNIFYEIEHVIDQIKLKFDSLIAGDTSHPEQLHCLVSNLQMIYNSDPDTSLGAIHLNHYYPYSCLHPVYCTLLCEMAAQGIGISQEASSSLASAALTANLGMYSYHDRLINQASPLSVTQRNLLKKHPEKSIEILKASGIDDELWLKIVRQHHERGDGNGYPDGLAQEQICLESAIVGVADTYLSYIMPRSYRNTIRSREALRTIYKAAKSRNKIINIGFIKQITIYPPGTFVRLKNGEVAMVTKRNLEKPNYPNVASIMKPDGSLISNPVFRDVTDKKFAILDVYEFKQQLRFDSKFLWEIFCPQ